MGMVRWPQWLASSESVKRGALGRWLGWFGIANLLLVTLLSLRYLGGVTLPAEGIALVFTAAMYLGHLPLLVYLLLLPLFLVLVIIPSRRLITLLAVSVATLGVLALIIDTFVFLQYRFHINGAIIGLLTGGAAKDIFVFSPLMYLLTVLVLVAVVALEWWLAGRVWRWLESRPVSGRPGLIVSLLLVTLILGQNLAYAWADAVSYTAVTRQVRILPVYQPTQMRRELVAWGLVDENEVAQTVSYEKSGSLHYPQQSMVCERPAQPLNIMMIVMDSWRFDEMDGQVTPNIHALGERGWQFGEHFSGGNATRAGIFSLFYGIPATYWETMLAETRGAVLFDELLRQEFQLGIYAAAPLYGPEFDRTVFAAVPNLRKESPGNSPHEKDNVITEEFLAFLQARDRNKPFFGFLFYDSPHAYDFPANYGLPFQPSWKQVNYMALNNDSDPTEFFNRHRNSVHYVDSQIGRVLNSLKQDGLLDSTLVIITGDHGQEFNDNRQNYWGHNGNFSRYQTQVPMIIHWPGKGARVITQQTSHLDVAPTLMKEVLGCTNAVADYSTGMSLLDEQVRPPFVIGSYNSLFAVREGHLVQTMDRLGNSELFDDKQQYQLVAGENMSATNIIKAIEDIGRFYAQ